MSQPKGSEARIKQPTLAELAKRINAHLKRIEADPALNVPYKEEYRKTLRRFWGAGAGYGGGARMLVTYVAYQGHTALTKEEAIRYLERLDAGFVGTHFKAFREIQVDAQAGNRLKCGRA